MNEEEAKTKWCPYAKDPRIDKCQGARCMAWQQTGMAKKVYGKDQYGTRIVAEYPAQGYCGLAGKP